MKTLPTNLDDMIWSLDHNAYWCEGCGWDELGGPERTHATLMILSSGGYVDIENVKGRNGKTIQRFTLSEKGQKYVEERQTNR